MANVSTPDTQPQPAAVQAKEEKKVEAQPAPKADAAAPPKAEAPASPKPMSKEDELRKLIDEEKKKIPPLIDSIKRSRRRLSYKLAEKAAMEKLSSMAKDNTREIGYLRKRKEQLEFRIATEAFSLQAEKDLIRKKSEIEAQLEEALKSFRLKRKVEYINKDIEDLTKEITGIEAKINEVDRKLDELYGNLRKMTGQMRRRPRPEGGAGPRKTQEPKQAEISLADIAIIKGKEKKHTESESGGD